VGLRSPPGDHLAVSGRLFVELDDGRRLRATGGTVRASYGDFFRKRRVSRDEVERSILGLVGKDPDHTQPPRLAWEQLSGVLAREGLGLSDDELIRLPFDVEFSDELVGELDRS
jgi:hypothetical protein